MPPKMKMGTKKRVVKKAAWSDSDQYLLGALLVFVTMVGASQASSIARGDILDWFDPFSSGEQHAAPPDEFPLPPDGPFGDPALRDDDEYPSDRNYFDDDNLAPTDRRLWPAAEPFPVEPRGNGRPSEEGEEVPGYLRLPPLRSLERSQARRRVRSDRRGGAGESPATPSDYAPGDPEAPPGHFAPPDFVPAHECRAEKVALRNCLSGNGRPAAVQAPQRGQGSQRDGRRPPPERPPPERPRDGSLCRQNYAHSCPDGPSDCPEGQECALLGNAPGEYRCGCE